MDRRGGYGGRGNRGRGHSGNNQDHFNQHQEGGSGSGSGSGRGRGGGRGRGRGRGPSNPPVAQQWEPRPIQTQGAWGTPFRPTPPALDLQALRISEQRAPTHAPINPPPAQPWGPRPVQTQGGSFRPPAPSSHVAGPSRTEPTQSSGRGAWGMPVSGRAWPSTSQPNLSPSPPQAGSSLPDIQASRISEQKSLPGSSENSLLPIKRPDNGGIAAVGSIKLLVNHFPVAFNSQIIIRHYDVVIKQDLPPDHKHLKKPISRSDMSMIMDKLFSDNPDRFPLQKIAFDGVKNIYSAGQLPNGDFTVELSDAEATRSRSYIFSVTEVGVLKVSKLRDYLSAKGLQAEGLPIPRDVLQGMDLVMKQHPSRNRITFGRSTYSKEYCNDLGRGIGAFTGFQQSLKPTSQGLALCLDSSVLAFHKRLPVIEYLIQRVVGVRGVNDISTCWTPVSIALKGLKVYVTHRATKQKYTITGITKDNTRKLTFTIEDPAASDGSGEIHLVDYFREKYGKEILHQDIPCLDVGKGNRKNYIPMEFCELVEGQRYQKEKLDRNAATFLKKISLPEPAVRKKTICDMLRANDGPCGGEIIENFGIEVDQNMTRVSGRVIGPPELMIGGRPGRTSSIRVDNIKRQWNLVGKSVLKGIPIERWALIDFSSADKFNRLNPDKFIVNLMDRCKNLGIYMAEPLACRFTNEQPFSSVDRLRQLLDGVVRDAARIRNEPLQIIICPMPAKLDGYKSLKWVSETQVGVVTQCCLSKTANEDRGRDQYFANLAMKINAKLGGSNFELNGRLPRFGGEDHVMFIGADVNHPAAFNATCPSIAAVVATVNWPAANRYAARVCPQIHRTERIMNFGSMCLELVKTYALTNKVKPNRIVVFRDGVSEGQFDMVLKDELEDLKNAVHDENYRPTITLVVAQKRHQTRLFLEDERDGGPSKNVPPGTVVDTIVVHPREFDFYLNSHYGGLGTSKPTHYYVLYDDHGFTSDQLQKLIYDLCFTFVRCTKPVSLVTPVYYADLVAYRGRMFQEVMSLEGKGTPHASSSSSFSVSPSSLPDASIDYKFYNIHPELQNVMFFV